MKTLKYPLLFIIAGALAFNVGAGENTAPNPFFAVLNSATPVELPAKAAELVAKANSKQLQQTTIDVVRAAVPLNPAAAPAIVGSIAQSSPEAAAIAAATAVTLVPDEATAVARAAAAAAPTKAGQIVEAMCRVLPTEYQKIADAVAEVVPGANKEILTAISTAIPVLTGPINQTVAGYNGNVPSVSSVLDQVQSQSPTTVALSQSTLNSPSTSTPLPQSTLNSPKIAPPTFGAPYVPHTGGGQNVDPGSGGEVPTGGRGYASP